MSSRRYEAHDAETFDPITDLYWPFTAFGIKASYPTFDISRMLTPPVLARYHDVTTKGCWYYAYAAMKEIGRQGRSMRGWIRAPEARRLQPRQSKREQADPWSPAGTRGRR